MEGGQKIFLTVPARSLEVPEEGEWPAKLGRNEQLLGQLSSSETLSYTHLLLRSRRLDMKLDLTAM